MNGVRGSRGKKKSNPIETHNRSTTQLVVESGKYYECFDCEDRSLTKAQYLRLFTPGSTLLIKGKPFDQGQMVFKRESSNSKIVHVEIEEIEK